MSNIFDSLRNYPGKWSISESRNFTEVEIGQIDKAVVVPSQYGNSVQFSMVGGGMTFIPLSNTSSKKVGDSIDMKDAKLLTLSKPGEADIYRVEA